VLLSSVGRELNGVQSSSSRAAVGNGDWKAMTLLIIVTDDDATGIMQGVAVFKKANEEAEER
jgi:hypothetical protein